MQQEQKAVLLTGGTGFIGGALSDKLLQQGYKVYIFTRDKKRLLLNNQASSKIYFLDWKVIEHISISIVINLAGEPIAQRWSMAAKRKMCHSRIDTTSQLIAFMKRSLIKPELFISGSAVGYYGPDQETVFTERTPVPPVNNFFSSSLCHQWEQAASPALEMGIRTVVLRIGPVLDNQGGMLAKLWPSFYLGLGGPIGTGKQWLSWIDRDDLVRLIVFVIQTPSLFGPLNATAPHPVTNQEFAEAFAHSLNRPCFFKTPGWVLKTFFGQMAEEMLLQGQNVLPQKALEAGFHFLYPTITESLRKNKR